METAHLLVDANRHLVENIAGVEDKLSVDGEFASREETCALCLFPKNRALAVYDPDFHSQGSRLKAL